MQENFIKVAYIGMHRENGTMMINVPLYIKVGELNPNGLTDSEQSLIDHVAEIMNKCYENQLREYFANRKKLKEQAT